MKIIGVTGGTGAGKSAVCAELKKCGATVIDADLIAKQVVLSGEPAFDEIVLAFGEEILAEDGQLNRKKLADIVFSDKEKLKLLNEITHKFVFAEMNKRLEEAKSEIVVLDVPLLFQCGFPIKCHLTVSVLADREERIARVMERDKISREAVLARMSGQLSDDEYRRLADVCFVNNGDVAELQRFAKGLCEMVKNID